MADFLATVVAGVAVVLIERLVAYLTRTVFTVAFDQQLRPAWTFFTQPR